MGVFICTYPTYLFVLLFFIIILPIFGAYIKQGVDDYDKTQRKIRLDGDSR